MWRCSLVALALSSACQFDRPVDQMPVDAPLVDAAPTCVADTITCAADTYVECGPDGFATRTLACPLGCAPDVAKCLDIDPLNGLATYLDMVADPPDVVLMNDGLLDPETGALFDGATSVAVPMFMSPTLVRVYVVDSLTIERSLVVPARQALTPPIAIVSRGDIIVRGLIDVGASGRFPGPGGLRSGDMNDKAVCSGGWIFGANAPQPTAGGGGAGGAMAGGSGGDINAVAGAPAGMLRTATEPLAGGCQGGSVFQDATTVAWAGSGGGGLQLASRTRIRFIDNGSVDASGSGAEPAPHSAGGAGGGGGGTIVLEAPQVILDGAAVVLSTKGGGGSGASSTTTGGAGSDGGTNAVPATGGTSPVGNLGGRGGTDVEPFGGGSATGAGVSGGGGGGAAGAIAIYTASGGVNPTGGAALRGVRVVGQLRTRHTP